MNKEKIQLPTLWLQFATKLTLISLFIICTLSACGANANFQITEPKSDLSNFSKLSTDSGGMYFTKINGNALPRKHYKFPSTLWLLPGHYAIYVRYETGDSYASVPLDIIAIAGQELLVSAVYKCQPWLNSRGSNRCPPGKETVEFHVELD